MAENIPPCHIRIDKEGNWYYQNLPIINKKVYLYLNQCISRDQEGRYILLMDKERCYLEVEDTPFVIRGVSLRPVAGRPHTLFVKLNDETEEELNTDTLRVGEENVLYCKVKEGMYEAHFLRAGHYQLAQFLQHDEKGYHLLVEGKRICLKNL